MAPTTGHDRSTRLYEPLGFETRADFPWRNGYRWVEMYPPGATTGISLVPSSGGSTEVQSGIILNTDDIVAAHAVLKAARTDVDDEVARVGPPAEIQIGAVRFAGAVPPMFYLRDRDGNALLVVQPN
jgi:hypothetical protein